MHCTLKKGIPNAEHRWGALGIGKLGNYKGTQMHCTLKKGIPNAEHKWGTLIIGNLGNYKGILVTQMHCTL